MIPVAGPSITEKEIAYVTDAAQNAWYERAGEWYARFETAFARHCGTDFAVSLPSCTAGLHLALAAFGIGPGDEVIVPDATWIASAAPVSYVGATPVFADMDPETWCMSPRSLAECLARRTKAVIPVDLYGGMPDMDNIRAVCAPKGIRIIEDAAEAVGSEYHGRAAGSLGDCGVFSFHGSKTLTTGEGGMLVSSDSAFFDRVLFLRDHGRIPGDVMFYNAAVAFKYKMSSLQAAFGLAQLERIGELIEKKRLIFSWYAARLAGIPGLTLNAEPAGTRNSYWMVTAAWEPSRKRPKEAVMEALKSKGVASRPFFHPLSSIPAYRDTPQAAAARARNAASYRVCPNAVNLPSALCLTEDDVDRACTAFLEALR